MARRHSHLLIASLTALLVSMPTEAVVHLSFGLYTSNKPTTMVKQFRPVLDLVEARTSEQLGTAVEIRIQVAKDYEQGIAHLASGKVDFSRFGPASYIEAKRANAGLRILAMERVRGDKVFYGIIAVGKDSPITSVAQLRGASFAFGNDQSTIGRYLSQLFLRNHGVVSSDLSRFEYLGRHDTVGTAVGAGHFDAGALNEATFSKLVAKGVAIRELARFPNVTKPWIAREGLPERLFLALREALLEIEDPVITALLKADGFVPGEDSDFTDIRAAIEMNGKFFEPNGAGIASDTATKDDGVAVEPATGVMPPIAKDASTQEEGNSAGVWFVMDPGEAGIPTASRPEPDVVTTGESDGPGSTSDTRTARGLPDAPPDAAAADGSAHSSEVKASSDAPEGSAHGSTDARTVLPPATPSSAPEKGDPSAEVNVAASMAASHDDNPARLP